jgi:mRNA interferase RelE/StbE
MYEIVLLEKAISELYKLPQKEADKIVARIDKLQENPYPKGCKKLQGYDEVYRVRQGNYRILYEVRVKQLIIQIIKIGSRKDVYR